MLQCQATPISLHLTYNYDPRLLIIIIIIIIIIIKVVTAARAGNLLKKSEQKQFLEIAKDKK